jgi:hypothetical protein
LGRDWKRVTAAGFVDGIQKVYPLVAALLSSLGG